MTPGAMSQGLPVGFGVVMDQNTRLLDQNSLFGGSPARVLRLTEAGRAALAELRGGTVRGSAASRLARKLTDAGLAHPRPPELTARPDVTVIVPVRDRAVLLDRCLTAQGRRYPVIVVDDGSRDAAAVAAVAAAHGATLVRRQVSGGPGPARNAGLLRVTTPLVAMLDSDTMPEPDWIDRLAAHLADPAVAVAAPRIVPVPADPGWAGRYTTAACPLDLGDKEARVVPGAPVAYVPTAALLARRAALVQVAGDDGVFDPAMSRGEDVDLVWRLHAAAWRIRYDPRVRVAHHEPAGWPKLLARRFRYGTSAAPLAQRHQGQVPPLVLHPWPACTVAGILTGNPAVALASFTASVLATRTALRRAGVPARGVLPEVTSATWHTWLGVGRYACQFGLPVLAAALVAPGGASRVRRWTRRAAVASLLLGPPLAAMSARRKLLDRQPSAAWSGRRGPLGSQPLADWFARCEPLDCQPPTVWSVNRQPLDPVRYVLGHLADDVAYGAGVWTGSLRARNLTPVRPVISRRRPRR